MINAAGREIPEYIETYGKVEPFTGAYTHIEGTYEKTAAHMAVTAFSKGTKQKEPKLLRSIEEAIDRTGLKDGMTVSFHHHMRNGDYVVNMVMEAIEKKGLKDIQRHDPKDHLEHHFSRSAGKSDHSWQIQGALCVPEPWRKTLCYRGRETSYRCGVYLCSLLRCLWQYDSLLGRERIRNNSRI